MRRSGGCCSLFRMAPPPKKQLRYGRVAMALILLGGIITGIVYLIVRK